MSPVADLEIMEPAARSRVTPEQGEKYLAAFRAKFVPKGLLKVIERARAAESGEGRGAHFDQLQEAEILLARSEPGSPARASAQFARDRIWVRCEGLVPGAEAASRAVWRDPQSIKMLRDDLDRLLDAVESEMERVIDLQMQFHDSQGLPCDRASLEAISIPFVALKDFKEKHLDQPVWIFRERAKDPEGFANHEPSHVSWILARQSWRNVLTS